MKKIKCLQVLGLLLLTVAIVTGCGGGPNDDPPATNVIHFSMPSTYYSATDSSVTGAIPSGKTVKFYTLTAANHDELSNDTTGTATVKADHTFTATTGASDLQFALPEALLDQERYIYAVIIIDGTFDLDGKTKADLQSAVAAGDVIYGKTEDASGDTQSVTLTKDSTVANFEFVGLVTDPVSFINITMPSVYYDYTSDASSAASSSIPTGKTVKFYALTDFSGDTISADLISTATTGASTLQLELPDTLIGESRYIWAVVILNEDDFDLDGQTKDDLVNALENGSILYGKAVDSSATDTENILVPLTNGIITVPYFVFIGKI
jgi:hypothetical protein